MTSTQFSPENEIVISFFENLQLMLKYPRSRRLIEWRMRFFDKAAAALSGSPIEAVVNHMNAELALCNRRRRSRFRMYNVSDIDEVAAQYYIHKSPVTLGRAWDLFMSGRYRIQ